MPAEVKPTVRKTTKTARKVHTFEAGRPLDIGEGMRNPGELVPEACTWLRVMSLVHTGYLKTVEVDESDFDAAVKKFCPELTEQVNRLSKEKTNGYW